MEAEWRPKLAAGHIESWACVLTVACAGEVVSLGPRPKWHALGCGGHYIPRRRHFSFHSLYSVVRCIGLSRSEGSGGWGVIHPRWDYFFIVLNKINNNNNVLIDSTFKFRFNINMKFEITFFYTLCSELHQ